MRLQRYGTGAQPIKDFGEPLRPIREATSIARSSGGAPPAAHPAVSVSGDRAPDPPDFDLADIPSPNRCDARSSVSEIVVCGRRIDNGPLVAATDYVPLPEIPGPGIGYMVSDTVRANLFAQSVELPGGFISNRAMVTFTIPF